MTDEQQYVYNELKNMVPDKSILRQDILNSQYKILPVHVRDMESLGEYLATIINFYDPLPVWAWENFDYAGYAASLDVVGNIIFPLSNGRYVQITCD